MMRKWVLVLFLALPLFAQKKQITFDALYDPTTKIYFNGAVQGSFAWIDDATFVWPKTDEKGELVEWRLFDVTTGRQRPFFEKAKLQRALEGAGLSPKIA